MWLVYVLVPVLLGRVQDCGWEWLTLERGWSEDWGYWEGEGRQRVAGDRRGHGIEEGEKLGATSARWRGEEGF